MVVLAWNCSCLEVKAGTYKLEVSLGNTANLCLKDKLKQTPIIIPLNTLDGQPGRHCETLQKSSEHPRRINMGEWKWGWALRKEHLLWPDDLKSSRRTHIKVKGETDSKSLAVLWAPHVHHVHKPPPSYIHTHLSIINQQPYPASEQRLPHTQQFLPTAEDPLKANYHFIPSLLRNTYFWRPTISDSVHMLFPPLILTRHPPYTFKTFSSFKHSFQIKGQPIRSESSPASPFDWSSTLTFYIHCTWLTFEF